MSKQRTTVSFEGGLVAKLNALMKLRDFGGNQSAFLSQLVREEYERRHGPVMFKSATLKRTGAAAASSGESSSRPRSHNPAEMGNLRKPRKFPKG